MIDVLQDSSPAALTNAIEENLFAFFPLLRCLPQAEVHDAPDILWELTNIPITLFNSVLRARLAPQDVDATIESAISRCRSRNVPMLWWTGPTTRPSDLGTHLEQHGFVHNGEQPGMALDLLCLNENLKTPSNLTIQQVTDDESLKRWNHARSVGFGASTVGENAWLDFCRSVGLGIQQPLRYYTGLLDDAPVAASMLFFGAGVAGIYNVATIPEARRKGIGAAVTLAPLRDACALGYRVAILIASKMGESVYRQLGFQEYCKIGSYVWRDKQEK